MERETEYTDYELQQMRDNDLWHQFDTEQSKLNNMIATIEASSFTGKTFQNKYGTMYVHSVTINGEVGAANAKKEMPDHFKVGTTVEVERTEDEYGVKFKISKPKENTGFSNNQTGTGNQSGNTDTQKMIVRQNTLQRAFEYYANGWHGSGQKPSPQDLTSLADEFTAWVIK